MKTHHALGVMGMVVLLLAGCGLNIDSPQTPTVAASPTLDETQIALHATPTWTLTKTPTVLPSRTLTSSPTQTSTATFTVTVSVTSSPTGTAVPSATLTLSPPPTATPFDTPTHTASPLPSITSSPIKTPSPTLTISPTQEIVELNIPTATDIPTLPPTLTSLPSLTSTIPSTIPPAITDIPHPTETFTPFPTITPNLTATSDVLNLDPSIPTVTYTPGGIYTLTPLPPPLTPLLAPATPEGGGAFSDPNALASGQDGLSAPQVSDNGPSGPPLAEQQRIVVSYQGQVVPLLGLDALTGGVKSGAALDQGAVFAVSAGGNVAVVRADRLLYVNGAPMLISPANRFGMPENLAITDLAWAPDGARIAFRVDAGDPNQQNAIDSGIWVYEPATARSWQVFRTGYAGQIAPWENVQRPLTIRWSPDGTRLLVPYLGDAGRATALLDVGLDINTLASGDYASYLNEMGFADATWSLSQSAVIVSGSHQGGATVLGRIDLGAGWTYEEYLNQAITGLVMEAAAELTNGWIGFLGSSGGSFALYTVAPYPGSSYNTLTTTIPGTIVAAAWNDVRSAVLVTVQNGGASRLWLLTIGGTARDVTPPGGAPDVARWR